MMLNSNLCRLLLVFAIGLSAISLSGCSGEPAQKRAKIAKVKGKLVYKGKPVTGAAVGFYCAKEKVGSSGVTDDKGEFVLTTYNTGDGACVGENIVTVSKGSKLKDERTGIILPPPPKSTQASGPGAMGKGADIVPKGVDFAPTGDDAIPAKYADLKTSGLKQPIVEGINKIEIELKE